MGLRGVGKTVLLNTFGQEAVRRNWVVVEHELTARGDLLATLARLAHQALLELAPPSAWARATRRTGAILRSMEISYQITGLSVSLPAADAGDALPASGDLARDVTELLLALGSAAAEHERGVTLRFDELQFAPNRITAYDAQRAGPLVREWLDRGFFTFRTDRLPTAQRRYLRAMAELGSHEQASGDIATALGLSSSAPVGQTRDALIRRGLIYSPRLGYAAFTVPQFDDYLRRHFELEAHSPRRRTAGEPLDDGDGEGVHDVQ